MLEAGALAQRTILSLDLSLVVRQIVREAAAGAFRFSAAGDIRRGGADVAPLVASCRLAFPLDGQIEVWDHRQKFVLEVVAQ